MRGYGRDPGNQPGIPALVSKAARIKDQDKNKDIRKLSGYFNGNRINGKSERVDQSL